MFKTTLNEFKTRDKYIRVSVFKNVLAYIFNAGLLRTTGGSATDLANRILAKSS